MRFDAPEHVDAWRSTGRFPVIHDAIVRLVQEEIDPRAGTVLDVGSSTGLLTRRLTDSGYVVAAAQEPGAALDAGRLAGLYDGVPVFDQRITPATLPDLLDWLQERGVTAVVARRVFPELHDALGPEMFGQLAAGLGYAGVRTIVLEGRQARSNTLHALGSRPNECEALAPAWTPVVQRGPLATLEATHGAELVQRPLS